MIWNVHVSILNDYKQIKSNIIILIKKNTNWTYPLVPWHSSLKIHWSIVAICFCWSLYPTPCPNRLCACLWGWFARWPCWLSYPVHWSSCFDSNLFGMHSQLAVATAENFSLWNWSHHRTVVIPSMKYTAVEALAVQVYGLEVTYLF